MYKIYSQHLKLIQNACSLVNNNLKISEREREREREVTYIHVVSARIREREVTRRSDVVCRCIYTCS